MITATSLPARQSPPLQLVLPIGSSKPLRLPEPVDRGDLGELRHRVARFMQAVAEVIGGERPARQLGGWLTANVLDDLQRHSLQRASCRTRIASVHVSRPAPHAAEVAARAVRAGRSFAIAARLERTSDVRGRETWRCTALVWA